MFPARRTTARDWLLAFLAGVLAVILRAAVQPWTGDHLPFIVAYPATLLASLLWGTGPGLVTALICAAATVSPRVPPDIPDLARPVQLGGFLLTCIVVALVCGQRRRRRVDAAAALSPEQQETPLISWLRATLWGAFLIPATAFIIAAWWGYDRAEQEAEAVAVHACDLAYRHALRTFTITAEIAARADAASVGADDPAHEASIHQRLSDLTAGLPSVTNLNVWDANGRALVQSHGYPADRSTSVEDRAYFQEQRDRPNGDRQVLDISAVLKGRQTGQEITNASIRRTSADGSFRGVVSVSLSPEYFREYYRLLASDDPKLATFTLTRTDGEMIARLPPATQGRTHVFTGSPILARVQAGEMSGSMVLTASPDQETRLVAFKRVDGYPLYVVAGFSRKAMFANWGRFVGLLAALMVPITVGLVYVSWVALQRTRREQATFEELQEQIRRRAAAEKSMLESQKLETLAFVTGGVAHDFNNLLAIVNASLHVLKRRHPDVAEEKQVIAMSRAIQSGVRLTRQLLSFSRKQALRPETVNLQTWLPASVGLIQSTLGPHITWLSSVDAATLPVHVDLGELELALINLVVNARHAMPGGGSLSVHVGNAPYDARPDAQPRREADRSAARAMVSLSVRDSGVGIPAALLSKVLEPFFTTREKGVGSGLGLSQVQGFCIQAGGFVRIESIEGSGTTVSMYLPASAEVATAAASDTVQGRTPPPLQGRVLLVEDNEALASTTELMLKTAGLTVVCAASADAALTYLNSSAVQPDVVLSDIAMPGRMNGIELAFALRRQRPDLPVLLTTGYAEQVNEATAAGLRVLPKPTAPEELLAELRAALALPSA